MSDLDRLAECLPALRRYAWVLARHRGDADDLVQEALLRAVDRLQGSNQIGNLRAWLLTIMHNLFISHLRKQRTRGTDVSLDLDDAPQPGIPAHQEGALQMRDLMRNFDRLPEDQRQVLMLVAVEGLSYAEIATLLSVPLGTVMSRLSRGREKLRNLMDGVEQPGTRPDLRRVK